MPKEKEEDLRLSKNSHLAFKGNWPNHKAVLRIMNKYNMLAEIRRRRRYVACGQSLFRYDNILSRRFEAEKLNNIWVTDVSYIHTQQGVLYLSAIKDLHDGFIVAHKTAVDLNFRLVDKTLKAALEKEKIADGMILHSDQGFQYTSLGYYSLTKEYGIKPSMSRRGNCFDNACIENFFGILKTECIYRAKIATLEEARLLIDEYVYFYNYERIQLKTKLTPYEKRCQSV
jgi:putative transposase